MGISNTPGDQGSYNEDNELQTNQDDNLNYVGVDYGSSQTNTTIITPSAGKKLEIHSIVLSSSATTGVSVIEFLTSGGLAYKFYHTSQSRGSSGIIHLDGNIDEVLSISCPANTFIGVVYHEHS